MRTIQGLLGACCSGLLLLPGLALPLEAAQQQPAPSPATAAADWLARGGGGRGGGGGGARAGGGGGNRGGGGGHRSGGGQRGQTGFQNAGGGLNRGSNRPTGGWSDRVGSDRARPSIDRPVSNRDGSRDLTNRDLTNRDLGNRSVDRNIDRNINRNFDANINRDWGRSIDIGDVNLYPGWARPGWGVARPWNWGWYGGWATPTWGWWGARAAAWGIGTLATAAIINDAVDNAVSNQVSYIVVPNSNYQLLYGTVSPSGSNGVSFDVTANGSTYRLTADCKAGTLNGREPSAAAEAELLNAACQVAYGSV
jgi:hypothetical protein